MEHSVLRRTVLGAAAAALPLIAARRGAAAERSLQVGIYSAQQGEYVRKTIIPQFETDYGCKVYATEGFTLSQIAALRATKDNPRFSAMFMDDLGVEIAKREGLIEQLPADKIPNMARVIKRFIFFDGYGAGFAISTVGLVINPQSIKPLASYGELWDERFRGRYMMITPKFTQSVHVLIAAAALVTGKPLGEAQYHCDEAWGKIAELKPNVQTVYDNTASVMFVAQGQADIAGPEYSKGVYPYIVKGAALAMNFPREGAFSGINCLTLVKGAPEPELGVAFINRMLEPSVQQGLAEATFAAPSISGLTFKPDAAKWMAYPESKMEEMGLFTADWVYVNPRRPAWLEKYNQIFGS